MNCAHKVTTKSDLPSNIDEITDNGDVITRLSDGQVHVVGATQWLWARPDPPAIVDVLFVDEAGQMSLANVLAASQAAHSVVLLGDPQQLEQPQQGYHPIGTDVSALEHILQGHKTISSDRGIFLPETWRLAPSICAFTSEVFYEGRLHARAGLERQALVGTPPFEGAGLWVVPVAHDGNQNSSNEEAAIIERIVGGLVHPNARWTDRDGDTHAITPNDILIVAPYNSQVSLLAELLATRGVALARWINSRDRRRRWWSTRWRPPGRKTPRAGWSSYIASTG
jgi:superfamily I DNA and/or RNA helicase